MMSQSRMRADPAEMPAAGMATGLVMRVKNHTLSHYEPIDPGGWTGNPTMKLRGNHVYPAPEYVPRSLLTEDLPGARPRTRPGLGMGHTMAPNGMTPFRTSLRSSDPLRPDHLLPVHIPNDWKPPTMRTGPMERDQKQAGLALGDIPGSSPYKAKPQRQSYNYMDYKDVSGLGRYSNRYPQRDSSNLMTRDIVGANPMSFIKTRPRPGEDCYAEVEKSKPCRPPHYGFGRWPPPSVVQSSFPRVGRDGPNSVAVFTMPKPQRTEFSRDVRMHEIPFSYSGAIRERF